ncbi:hypothetical protein EXH51_02240 [Pelomonas saccharophila]|uniref:hypothetical protein n=1 Tax=Roseateles saccharophilus TaxID=304 RepID=UPI0024081D6C|nr:hypothetical protein [Roseateles saccharophilus]MDG0831559.1 hypothetical protein [Roseateles saccharophilus]
MPPANTRPIRRIAITTGTTDVDFGATAASAQQRGHTGGEQQAGEAGMKAAGQAHGHLRGWEFNAMFPELLTWLTSVYTRWL